MKEKYQPIEIEVIPFNTEDVITTSGDDTCRWEGEEG